MLSRLFRHADKLATQTGQCWFDRNTMGAGMASGASEQVGRPATSYKGGTSGVGRLFLAT